MLPLSLAMVVAACDDPATPSSRPPASVAITGVTVVDVTTGLLRPGTTVVISGSRIAAIGPAAAVTVPVGSVVLDGTGRYLIPGLWDMHGHATWDRRFAIPLLIANGVTGTREMFGRDPAAGATVRRAIGARALIGPRMITAGRIVDGPDPVWPGSIAVSTAAGGRAAVARTRAEGADFVKVYSGLGREAYFAIAAESRKEGIAFAGHVPDSVTLTEASDAGQRSVEHLSGALEAATSDSAAAQVLARLRRNGTWQVPTLVVLRVASNPRAAALTGNPSLRYVPRTLLALWGLIGRMAGGDTSRSVLIERERTYRRQLELVGMMHRDSVPILAGSDQPNPYTIPGFSLHDELGLLVEAGLPPLAALRAATVEPARFLGALDSLGAVEAGKVADLVLLDANPLDDIRNTRRIAAVVVNGRLLGRPALDSILAAVEKSRWRPGVAAGMLVGAIIGRIPPAAIGLALLVVVAIPIGAVVLFRRHRHRRLRRSRERA